MNRVADERRVGDGVCRASARVSVYEAVNVYPHRGRVRFFDARLVVADKEQRLITGYVRVLAERRLVKIVTIEVSKGAKRSTGEVPGQVARPRGDGARHLVAWLVVQRAVRIDLASRHGPYAVVSGVIASNQAYLTDRTSPESLMRRSPLPVGLGRHIGLPITVFPAKPHAREIQR